MLREDGHPSVKSVPLPQPVLQSYLSYNAFSRLGVYFITLLCHKSHSNILSLFIPRAHTVKGKTLGDACGESAVPQPAHPACSLSLAPYPPQEVLLPRVCFLGFNCSRQCRAWEELSVSAEMQSTVLPLISFHPKPLSNAGTEAAHTRGLPGGRSLTTFRKGGCFPAGMKDGGAAM